MSVNKDKPHIFVLPEDDANRQVANGFHMSLGLAWPRQMQVLAAAGGRNRVLDLFACDHVPEMNRNHLRFVLLLIDFDGTLDWLPGARARIPANLANRVFILGAWTDPETLRQARLGSYEEIGRNLAEDCRACTSTVWGHALLAHNAQEVERLRQQVAPILFQ